MEREKVDGKIDDISMDGYELIVVNDGNEHLELLIPLHHSFYVGLNFPVMKS